jgi:hypothetical protein
MLKWGGRRRLKRWARECPILRWENHAVDRVHCLTSHLEGLMIRSNQLDSAVELSDTFHAQHTAAQSTILIRTRIEGHLARGSISAPVYSCIYVST